MIFSIYSLWFSNNTFIRFIFGWFILSNTAFLRIKSANNAFGKFSEKQHFYLTLFGIHSSYRYCEFPKRAHYNGFSSPGLYTSFLLFLTAALFTMNESTPFLHTILNILLTTSFQIIKYSASRNHTASFNFRRLLRPAAAAFFGLILDKIRKKRYPLNEKI